MTLRTLGVAVAVLLINVAGVLAAPAAFACSCGGVSEVALFRGADAVFVGRLVDRVEPAEDVSSADPVVLVFEVRQIHKGDPVDRQQVVTARSDESCGVGGVVSRDYLVFAEQRTRVADPVTPGQLATGVCDGTRPLASDGLAWWTPGWALYRLAFC